MSSRIQYILNSIEDLNPVHAKKLNKNIRGLLGTDYEEHANLFLEKYDKLLKEKGLDIDYSIDCYLKMLADVTVEQIKFIETGEYSSTSFDEVNRRVYSQPEVMEYYMHGLVLSQFLWKHHYDILNFFKSSILTRSESVSYLEVGAGHGLYLNEALSLLSEDCKFDVVDISPSSIELSKNFSNDDKVNFMLQDIYTYDSSTKYEFITMGEVLEHVERPVELLQKLKDLLKKDGRIFITTPANAPAIDHIYLFRNAAEIRDVIEEAGLDIEREFSMFVEDVPLEIAERLKITLMYGALLKLKN